MLKDFSKAHLSYNEGETNQKLGKIQVGDLSTLECIDLCAQLNGDTRHEPRTRPVSMTAGLALRKRDERRRMRVNQAPAAAAQASELCTGDGSPGGRECAAGYGHYGLPV